MDTTRPRSALRFSSELNSKAYLFPKTLHAKTLLRHVVAFQAGPYDTDAWMRRLELCLTDVSTDLRMFEALDDGVYLSAAQAAWYSFESNPCFKFMTSCARNDEKQ
jgi:hypothetical protein